MTGILLQKNEIWSEKYPGFIDKGNGLFRLPLRWIDKEGKERPTNKYVVEISCSVCGKLTLKNKENARRYTKTVCGKECLFKLKSNPDGFKKRKRGAGDSHIQIKKLDHPFADKNGYVLEHRLLIEEKIGRMLTRNENVHHINLIKDDNEITNLVLFSSTSEHHKCHGSLNKCVAELLKKGVLKFNRDKNTYEVI